MTHSGLNNSEMKNFRDNLSERRIEPHEALYAACLPNPMNNKCYRWRASSAYGDAGPQTFTSFRSIGVCRMKKPWPIHRHLQQPILPMKRTKKRQVLTETLGPMIPPRSTPRADMSRFIRPPTQYTSIHQCCLRRARRTTELLTLLDQTLRSHPALHACQILNVQREQLGCLR